MKGGNHESLLPNESIPPLKVVVIGKGVVGKSCLTYLFIKGNAPREHDATVEDRYESKIVIQNKEINLSIMDTAGEDDYQNMMDNWINYGDGFLLVFAINDETSFKALHKKRERILKTKSQANCPMVLVGNKKDLENDRKVTYNEAKALADSWGVDYIETSALQEINYKEAFQMIAEKIYDTQYPEPVINQRKCCCCIM